jgi:hypothetical protein
MHIDIFSQSCVLYQRPHGGTLHWSPLGLTTSPGEGLDHVGLTSDEPALSNARLGAVAFMCGPVLLGHLGDSCLLFLVQKVKVGRMLSSAILQRFSCGLGQSDDRVALLGHVMDELYSHWFILATTLMCSLVFSSTTSLCLLVILWTTVLRSLVVSWTILLRSSVICGRLDFGQ